MEKNFLDKMKDINKVPEETYLVTMDGHTNIWNSDSIAAVKRVLNKETNKTVATKVITTFLPPVLTLNDFIFNCKNYCQIKGYAMGTICAPSHANIFMDELERKYVYSFINNMSMLYLWYNDDSFMIGKATHD